MGSLIGWDKRGEKWSQAGFMNLNSLLSHRISSKMLMDAADANINANQCDTWMIIIRLEDMLFKMLVLLGWMIILGFLETTVHNLKKIWHPVHCIAVDIFPKPLPKRNTPVECMFIPPYQIYANEVTSVSPCQALL